MNLSFSHKVALITGAARGIGLATARAFAMSGANVAMADNDEEEVCKAASQLCHAGFSAAGFRCEVSHEAEFKRW